MKRWLLDIAVRFVTWASCIQNERGKYGFAVMPEEHRWTLHTLAAAPPDHPYPDYTFWVRPVLEADCFYAPEGVQREWFKVYEVESGTYAYGPTPKDALNNYWKEAS